MKKEKLQQLAHLIGGIIIMVHGFDTFEAGDYKPAAGYLGTAVVIMLLAGWHKTVVQRFLQGDVAFFLLECVIMFYSAWHYKTAGESFKFMAMAGFGTLYFVFAVLSISLNSDMPRKRRSKHRKKRRRRSVSIESDKIPKGFNRAIDSSKENAGG